MEGHIVYTFQIIHGSPKLLKYNRSIFSIAQHMSMAAPKKRKSICWKRKSLTLQQKKNKNLKLKPTIKCETTLFFKKNLFIKLKKENVDSGTLFDIFGKKIN